MSLPKGHRAAEFEALCERYVNLTEEEYPDSVRSNFALLAKLLGCSVLQARRVVKRVGKQGHLYELVFSPEELGE